MKYRVLSKRIQNINLNRDKVQIEYKIKNKGIWCLHSVKYPHFNRTIYEVEHILIQYTQSVVKMSTYLMNDEITDSLVITHLDM